VTGAQKAGRQLLEEIAAEKTIAIADPARNEPRDLKDLRHLTANEGVQIGPIIPAICQKLEFRGRPWEGLRDAITPKETRLAASWEARVSHHMISLSRFEAVFRAVHRTLRQPKLP
jgi:uncharacterized protein